MQIGGAGQRLQSRRNVDQPTIRRQPQRYRAKDADVGRQRRNPQRVERPADQADERIVAKLARRARVHEPLTEIDARKPHRTEDGSEQKAECNTDARALVHINAQSRDYDQGCRQQDAEHSSDEREREQQHCGQDRNHDDRQDDAWSAYHCAPARPIQLAEVNIKSSITGITTARAPNANVQT